MDVGSRIITSARQISLMAGSILGTVAVSGAPGGKASHGYANAGLAAIRDDIEP